MEFMNEKRKKIIQVSLSLAKLIILFSIVIGMPLYVYFNEPELIDRFNSLEDINLLLDEYKTASIFVYIWLQVIQIVISILPGQVLQFASGYIYGFWIGFLLSMTGVALGTVITFYLARLLGRNALHVIFGEERFSKFVHTLNSKRSYIVLFIIFLLPGIPKDILTYAAGVSEIKIRPFMILSLVGRTPAMIGSIMMGRMFFNGSYAGLAILGAAAVILFITGILFRDKLVGWTDRVYDKVFNKK
ncbi:MAG: VTT domain-containing protein [Eubacteriales bacterium]|nr:VTT domain-containing protein [Eubacteriales bacterium]MDD4121590.1 VTT domain-containing protein [Eubacteriales bacterium]MDD4629848.1 VTT domain-containing protein [Eubacteriales bacterium]